MPPRLPLPRQDDPTVCQLSFSRFVLLCFFVLFCFSEREREFLFLFSLPSFFEGKWLVLRESGAENRIASRVDVS